MKRYIRASRISDEPSDVQLKLAKNLNATEEELEELICDGSDWIKVRCALAHNPNMTPELIHQLVITEHYYDVFEEVAKNPKTSAKDLRRIAKSPQWYTRAIVALHPNTPDDVLEELKQDKDSSVRANANDTPERKAIMFKAYQR